MNELTPEFSRLISIARIPPQGVEEFLEAKPAEREGLAKRFDLISVKSLTAQLDVHPGVKQTITVTGSMHAEVIQRCIVTLEPVSALLDVDVVTHFIPAENHREGAGPPHADDMVDEFEVFSGGKIDLGETVAQYLGINLDPYPRKPGASLPPLEFGPKIDQPNALGQLKTLTKPLKNADKTEK
jgi:uncharacterized metal-binding protein YceD (DUF177 family)